MATKNKTEADADELREEYDLGALSGGVRGKYYERAKEGTNVVLLEPDVARAFPTPEAVNEALRALIRVAEASTTRRDEEQ